jgi:hypothetical protein
MYVCMYVVQLHFNVICALNVGKVNLFTILTHKYKSVILEMRGSEGLRK